MLIDCSYFTAGSRLIHNATLGTLPNADAMVVNGAIEAYIDECQSVYLNKVLGESLGNRVNAYLVCLDEDEKPVHHANLDAVCEQLKEPFADYVFFHFLQGVATQSTNTGLFRLKNANEHVSPIRRQVNVWNAMVEKHRRFAAWCSSSECTMAGINIDEEMLTKINQFNL